MNATTTLYTVPATTATRGFPGLTCLCCGNAEGNVMLKLDDVSQFHCDSCGEDFDLDQVRDHLAKWQRVVAWVELAPVAE